MSDQSISVPFNDLTRIHEPLTLEFEDALRQVLRTSNLVLGSEVSNFERELAESEGSKFAVGLNSGTTAIELALRSIGIKKGDEVITTSLTFVATCFAILQCGAVPVLVDIDPLTGLLNPNLIESQITEKTKALVFVSLHGRIENLGEVQKICESHGLKFIIDAAQSHLATSGGSPQLAFADLVTLSFYPGKNLGALGEGGAVLTNDTEFYENIKLMRDWGAKEKYNHTVWGGNYRLESLQAAFLRIKLKHLAEWTRKRQQIAQIYTENLKDEYLMGPISASESHVYHIYSIVSERRDSMCAYLESKEIAFGFHYPKAVHQQIAYFDKVIVKSTLKNAEWLASRTLSIPLFPEQKSNEIEYVVESLNNF